MSLRNKTIAEALREGKQRLRSAGKDAYAVEAELLLEKAVGLNRTALFLRGEEPLSAEAAMQYEGFLAERESGRPTQYILGTWEFMGLPFSVGEGVLIPRGDTEILVETILEKQQTEPLRTILDIGTGSGCIPVSLSHYGQFEYVLAVDISRKALGYATKNAAANHAEISFYESDLFQNIPAQWRGQLDAIVSNPPYSIKWAGDDNPLLINDPRFSPAGVLAPKSKADLAFIMHSLSWLATGGTAAIVCFPGIMYRGGAEQKIRKYLVENNYIDAIIGLPANIFYGTSIPTCILVMKKCRKQDDNILFIDASREFEKVKTQNKLRAEHINKIVETYRNRSEVEKYSHCATLQEIAENDYNLNIPRYVDTFEEEEPIDIHAVMAEIKELEAKRADLDKQIEVYLKELGIVE